MKRIKILLILFLVVVGASQMKIQAEDSLTYNGKEYAAKNLSKETREWLKWYNTLSCEEQEMINYVPWELRDKEIHSTNETILDYNNDVDITTLKEHKLSKEISVIDYLTKEDLEKIRK